MYWQNASPGAWVAMTFMMFVFWGVVVAAIVIVVRAFPTRHRDDPPASNDSGVVVDERPARGTVEVDEYQQPRELIRSK